jgi:ferrochelatase
MKKRIAVVLFNLGGPDCLDSVQPFLFNLFNDPAIIQLPNPFRWILARFISARRAPIAKEIYNQLGGQSPILGLTQDQADHLEKSLGDEYDVKCFIAMRYWHPMSIETAERVRDFEPDEIVLLPLYPQYSMTTTGSSLKEWYRASAVVGLDVPVKSICCYPEDKGWVSAQVDLINDTLSECSEGSSIRILFSAHGLPKKIVDKGDPYQHQVERTVDKIVGQLDKTCDWAICFQSRVGRLEWIGPSLDDELKRAENDKKQVIVVPVAFVSEHSETLVELDIEYKEQADELGLTGYHRVPAVGTHEKYIEGLANLVKGSLDRDNSMCSGAPDGGKLCSSEFGKCALLN